MAIRWRGRKGRNDPNISKANCDESVSGAHSEGVRGLFLSVCEREQDTAPCAVCGIGGKLSTDPILVSESGGRTIAVDRVCERVVSDHRAEDEGGGDPHRSDVDHVHGDGPDQHVLGSQYYMWVL